MTIWKIQGRIEMLANLFLRVLDTNGAVYLPYTFSGEWTDAEKEIVTNAIAPHVPERVDAGFNNFVFYKFGDGDFGAKRFTWEHIEWNSRSADELATKIATYYAK